MKSIFTTALLLVCTATAALAGPGTMITSNDEVGINFPLWVQSDTTGYTWGLSIGDTQGRMLRLQDQSPGLFVFYDLGIDQNENFFLTQMGTHIQALSIAPNGAATFADSVTAGGSLTAGGSVTAGGSFTAGGSLAVAGQVHLTGLPTASPGLKHVMVDSSGKLYVEP